MRRILVLCTLWVVGCDNPTQYNDAGTRDAGGIDAKFDLDAEPFVCEAQACGAVDACCPTACNANNDADCLAVCDNTVLEDGELCDPLSSCPTTCPAIGCQLRAVSGAACAAACADTTLQTICQDGDDCCPTTCNATNDAECAAVCGNSVIESGEHCDPLGTCPTSCPQLGCSLRTLFGDGTCGAQCVVTGQVGACTNSDGCCPAGCNANNDNDCTPVCGNSVVEAGEGCDGNCPVCPTETFSCFGQVGGPTTCDTQCHQPYTGCGPTDGCCPYKPGGGGADCNRGDDPECTGNRWQYVSFGVFSFAPCTTVRVFGLERYDSVLFTTCSPGDTSQSIGDTTITQIVSKTFSTGEQINYFPGLSVINDDTSDPFALPVLDGWTCRNSVGNNLMSTAPQNDGGLILRGTPDEVDVTVCGYLGSSGRTPVYVWWNGAGSAHPG